MFGIWCSPGALARDPKSILGVAFTDVQRPATPTAAAVVLGMFEPAAGTPPGPVVSHRVAHLRVQEAEEQGH